MKATFTLIAVIFTLGFASCTSSDNEAVESASNFNSIKAMYGVEESSFGVIEKNDIPSVTVAEMEGILEALRTGSNTQRDCAVSSENSGANTATTVSMTGSYKAITRSGSFVENFLLCVNLKFSVEKGKVYYWGTDYSYSSDLFEWAANGLSLDNVKGTKYTYAFQSTSYIYLKVLDGDDCLVRVPVVFKGSYDFETNKGTYSYMLSKFSN